MKKLLREIHETSLPIADRPGHVELTFSAIDDAALVANAVEFALDTYHIGLAATALIISVVSLALSLVGLELDARIGGNTGWHGEVLGALVLISVGLAVAAGLL